MITPAALAECNAIVDSLEVHPSCPKPFVGGKPTPPVMDDIDATSADARRRAITVAEEQVAILYDAKELAFKQWQAATRLVAQLDGLFSSLNEAHVKAEEELKGLRQ